MPFGKHIQKSRSLMEIKRYQNKFMHKRRSVAEHMWAVSKIAQGLALWEVKKFKNEVDMANLLQRAINHDIIEMTTGDILSGTKKRTEDMKKAIDSMEEIAFNEDLRGDLPKSWVEEFRGYALQPKDETIEGKIISAADTIDAMLECIDEIKLGNEHEFSFILIDLAESLIEIDLDSVRYFMKFALLDFGLDIRKYYGANVYRYIESIEFPDRVFLNQ